MSRPAEWAASRLTARLARQSDELPEARPDWDQEPAPRAEQAPAQPYGRQYAQSYPPPYAEPYAQPSYGQPSYAAREPAGSHDRARCRTPSSSNGEPPAR